MRGYTLIVPEILTFSFDLGITNNGVLKSQEFTRRCGKDINFSPWFCDCNNHENSSWLNIQGFGIRVNKMEKKLGVRCEKPFYQNLLWEVQIILCLIFFSKEVWAIVNFAIWSTALHILTNINVAITIKSHEILVLLPPALFRLPLESVASLFVTVNSNGRSENV